MEGNSLREIKFRMYDKKQKIMSPVHLMEWGKVKDDLFYFRGYYECHKGEWSVAACNNVNKQTAIKCGNENVLVNRYELMQYTGLKDKNGREIYEGDIYECDVYPTGDDKDIFTVVWFDTGLVGKQKSSGNHFGLKYWLDKIEVIGNVYEDGHLLVGRNDENG